MTRVEQISIEGLAGRTEPVSINLDPELNVFFGLNGTGKTSVLKILYSAIRNRTEALEGISFASASVKLFSHQTSKVHTRSIDTAKLDSSDQPTYYIDEDGDRVRLATSSSANWKSTPARDIGPFEATFLTTSRLAGAVRKPRHFGHPGETVDRTIDEQFAEEVQLLWRRYTNKTLSEVRQIQQAGLAQILQSLFSDSIASHPQELDAETAYYRSKEFLRRQGVDTKETLKSFTSRYAENPGLASIVHEIDSIERRIEKAEEPRHKLQELVASFVGGKQIDFTDRNIDVQAGSTSIPLMSLSSGEKQLVRILVDVINAGISTIIIDEPELSMHIDWQRELLTSLRTVNPDAQIIVATHSPEIMANVPDSQIFRL